MKPLKWPYDPGMPEGSVNLISAPYNQTDDDDDVYDFCSRADDAYDSWVDSQLLETNEKKK